MELRKYRERAGLTQTELGDKIGVSIKTILRYEKGTREPRASDIMKLCEVLQVSEAELLGGADEEVFRVELIIRSKEEDEEEMRHGLMRSNGFTVEFNRSNGTVGCYGAAKVGTQEELDGVIAQVADSLKEGFKVLYGGDSGTPAAV